MQAFTQRLFTLQATTAVTETTVVADTRGLTVFSAIAVVARINLAKKPSCFDT